MRIGWSLVVVLGLGSVLTAAEPTRIEPFSLADTTGKQVAPLGVKDQKALVVVFLGTECPINNAYLPRLAEMYDSYRGKGVGFVAINANRHDAAQRVAEHAKKFEIPFSVLKDENNLVADKFGARRTPEAFLLDASGRIQYRGRIDDQYGIGYKRKAPTHNYLAQAIDELLAGKPVTTPVTEVEGCLIARVKVKPKSEVDSRITYTNRIAALVDKNCAGCHRPGQIGPMSLRTYDDVAAWAEPIREAVSAQRMPPWHADPKHGHFANDRRLSEDERAALLTWIEDGCPRGAGEAPKGRDFAEGWTIGKPDAVYSMPEEYHVPAQGGRYGIPYKFFVVDPGFEEDRWIQAAEARPGNRAVVHHIIVFVMKRGERRTRDEDGIGKGFLVGYAPGDMPLVCPPGTARKIPKGYQLVFQMHYTPNGKAQSDRSSVGVIFAKQPPEQESRARSVATKDFVIPPGDANHQVVAASAFREDALLLSLSPHMHLRGKSFEYKVIFPDGKSEILLSVPKYDFNWQTTYHLEKPIRMPAGTRIECTAHYDNSARNPNNPDPKARVTWGDQTWEEMMIGFVDYVYLRPKKGE